MNQTIKAFKKWSICPFVSVIDFVEDKVRCRLLLTLPIIFIYYIGVLYILENDYEEKPIPDKIEQILSPSDYINIGEAFPRYPVYKIIDQYSNTMENITVSLLLIEEKYYTLTDKLHFICDYDIQEMYYWTSMYIRGLEACSIRLEGTNITSDSSGLAKFDSFKVIKASQGFYAYNIQVNSDVFISGKVLYISSTVSKINVLSKMPSIAFIGLPIDPQPIIQVFDNFGTPLANKKLMLFLAQ